MPFNILSIKFPARTPVSNVGFVFSGESDENVTDTNPSILKPKAIIGNVEKSAKSGMLEESAQIMPSVPLSRSLAISRAARCAFPSVHFTSMS